MSEWAKGYFFGVLMTLLLGAMAVKGIAEERIVQGYMTALTFSGESGIVGQISWETGQMVFTGNADASAKVFFDRILKRLIDNYIGDHCSGSGKLSGMKP